jgi:DNA-binding response OmpR family regulator
MRILLIEDNVRVGPLLRQYLKDSGFTVDLATSVADFQDLAGGFRTVSTCSTLGCLMAMALIFSGS